MLNSGAIVTAQIVRREVYGVYLDYQGEEILVLIPDIAWTYEVSDCREFAQLGEAMEVLILRHIPERQQYVGSIKGVHPEQDPWLFATQLSVGSQWPGKVRNLVTGATPQEIAGYYIELAPHVCGMLRVEEGMSQLQPGNEVLVEIVRVQRAERKIELRRIR